MCHDPEDTWGCHPHTSCPPVPSIQGLGGELGGREQLGEALQVLGGPRRSWGSVQHPDPTMPWWSQGTGGAEWCCPPRGGSPCWSQGTPGRFLLVPGVPRGLCPLQLPQSHHIPVVPKHWGGGQDGSAYSRGVPVGTGGGHRVVPAPTTTLAPPCPSAPPVPGGVPTGTGGSKLGSLPI